MTTAHDFTAQTLDGRALPLSSFAGKVLLVVNTASQCGFTPQYAGLQALYEKLSARGFAVLGFPCNQFGAQEPGDATQISRFCETGFGVRFPMFAKVEVNGAQAHPLFTYLKSIAGAGPAGEAIKWNFTKFLVDGSGQVVRRYAPDVDPAAIAADIEALLPR